MIHTCVNVILWNGIGIHEVKEILLKNGVRMAIEWNVADGIFGAKDARIEVLIFERTHEQQTNV